MTNQFWQDYKIAIFIIIIVLLLIIGQVLLVNDMQNTLDDIIDLKNETLETQAQLVTVSEGMKQIHEMYIAEDTIKTEYYEVVFDIN